MRKRQVVIGMILVLIIALHQAHAVEWSWTGNVSAVAMSHTEKELVEDSGLQGLDFEIEHVHWKIEAGLTDDVSLVLAPCLGHHGTLSIRYAYLDIPLIEDDFETILGMEIGRFIVPFGRFNYLAEVSNYPTISRPMMFASHDQDILMPEHHSPHPIFMSEYTETGVAATGNKWFDKNQLWYALWVGNGMYNDGYEGHAHGGSGMDMDSLTDIAWLQNIRFTSDNNSNKVFGARVSYSQGDAVTVGLSYMAGSYDHDAELAYSAVGIDVSATIGKFEINLEYVVAPTEFSAWDDVLTMVDQFDEYTTTGYYLQVVYPFADEWKVIGMYDVLAKEGPELTEQIDMNGDEQMVLPPGAEEEEAVTTKISLGVVYSPKDMEGVEFKAEYALFTFDPDPEENVQRFSLATVISF